jgi:hypothetical protein
LGEAFALLKISVGICGVAPRMALHCGRLRIFVHKTTGCLSFNTKPD